MSSLFPWNEKLLVVTCIKTCCYLYPWEPHSMLSAQHFDSPRNVAWCLLRQRPAWKGASKHYGKQHTKRFETGNVITGEEASNPDPQLTAHHLNPLNKRLYRHYIHPLRIYSICDEKKHCIFHSRRLATRRVGCQRKIEDDRWQSVHLTTWGLLCTLFARMTHTPMSSDIEEHLLINDKLWYE